MWTGAIAAALARGASPRAAAALAGSSRAALLCLSPTTLDVHARGLASEAGRLTVCVVGSGPAGMYTAEKVIEDHGDNAEVTVVDQLPTPYGLVRFGVAPDRPEYKEVIQKFGACMADPRMRFMGNVEVGRDVSLDELRARFHAVVVATGANSDRPMGVPGVEFGNSLSAREFVGWYNGHPDCRDLDVDLTSTDTAVIFGQGNVAIDCARVLLQPPGRLAGTDVAAHALEALRASIIRRVLLVGRRGPIQGAFSLVELRDLLKTEGVWPHIPPEELVAWPADGAEAAATSESKPAVSRMEANKLSVVRKAAAARTPAPGPGDREVHVRFFRSPLELVGGAGGRVEAVRMEVNRLEPGWGPRDPPRAVGTGEVEEVAAGLVLRSIGYRSLPFPGLPFDDRRHVVPNAGTRVVEGPGEAGAGAGPGLYVAGWLRRGAAGAIGINLHCAELVSAAITADLAAGALPVPREGGGAAALESLLRGRVARVVTAAGWGRIDAAEVAAGAAAGKPREKLPTLEQLLDAAGV